MWQHVANSWSHWAFDQSPEYLRALPRVHSEDTQQTNHSLALDGIFVGTPNGQDSLCKQKRTGRTIFPPELSHESSQYTQWVSSVDNCNTSDLGIIDPVSSPKIFSLFLKCTFSDTLTFLCTSLHPGIAQNKVTAAWDLKAVALLTCDMPEITCNWTPFATHTSN